MAQPAQGVTELLASLQRDINCLTDSDRSTRKRGLTTLQQKLFDDKDAPSSEILQEVFVRHLLPLVVRLLGDQVEKCRELSINILTSAAEKLPDPSPMLAPLLPAMKARIGTVPVLEDSEELRLQMMKLLGGPLLQRVDAAALVPVLDEAVAVLVHSYADAFHEMIKTACAATGKLTTTVGAGGLEAYVANMIKAIVPNLSHRHSAVRLAVLRALDALVLSGAPDATVVEVVVPAVRPLVFDHTPSVREAVTLVLARWMTQAASLPRQRPPDIQKAESLLAYPVKLLPLLLLVVTDENTAIGAKALEAVENVGEVYAQRVREAQEAAAEASAGPAGEAMEVSESVEGMSIDNDEETHMGLPYSAPFQGRPKQGARKLVTSVLHQLLPPILKDVKEWTVAQRSHAARELYAVLALAERASEAHADQLLGAVCSAVGDDEAAVASCVVSAAHMMGNFVAPSVWVPLLMEHLGNEKNSAQQRSNILVVLAALLLATRAERLPEECMGRVCAALASEDLRGSDHPGVRRQLHSSVANLVRAAGPRVAPFAKNLFLVLLQLKAQQEDTHLAELVAATLRDLAAACGMAGPEMLYAAHAGELLAALAADEPNWEAHSPGRYLLESLLRGCTAEVLQTHLSTLMPIVANCVALERDPHMRLAMLRMLDELFEDSTRGPAFTRDARYTILHLLVAPAVWRAGKTAAAVRYQAIIAFSTFLEKRLCPSDVLLSCIEDGEGMQLLPVVMTCMEEDYYADTRRGGTYLMEHVLQVAGSGIHEEVRRQIYPNLLKRLDDSNDEIRIRAASCCRVFWKTFTKPYDDTNSEYFTTGMVVHMDDADPRIQEAMCLAMEAAAVEKPHVVLKVVQAARNRHRSAIYCDRVLNIAAEAANK